MQQVPAFRPTTLTTIARTNRVSAVGRVPNPSRPSSLSLYNANDVIYGQGDRAGPLYLVEFGTVRICRLTADGRRQVSAFHLAGEIFGFESGPEHESLAESVNATGIRVLRANSDEELGASLLSVALRALARVQDHLLLLGQMTAAERMAAFLLDLHDRQDAGPCLELPMKRNDIADYLGLTFETVSRVLRGFKESRMIRIPCVSQIELVDLRALERVREGPNRLH